MNLLELAAAAGDGFDVLVARLRRLGVTRLSAGELELGPEPAPAMTAHAGPRERRTTVPPTASDLLRKVHGTMFAATSIRPPLPEVTKPTGNVPRAVVQRRARDGAADGEGSAT